MQKNPKAIAENVHVRLKNALRQWEKLITDLEVAKR